MRVLIAGVLASMALVAAPAPSAQAAAPTASAPVAYCVGVHGRLTCDGHSVRPVWQYRCIYVTVQDLEIIGWQEIVKGAFLSGVGLMADGTVFGLPVGAVLGLVGIGEGVSGSFIVWYADTYFQPGWYCGYVRVR